MNDNKLNELRILQKELKLHRKELNKCSDDLKIANKDLVIGEFKKDQLADETSKDLDAMMFSVSHKIRNSVANILGVSKILSKDENLTVKEWKKMLKIIIHSAELLNTSTEELSNFIYLKKVNCMKN